MACHALATPPQEASNEGTGTQTYISQARQRGMSGALSRHINSICLAGCVKFPNKIWPTKSNHYVPVRASCSRPRHTVSVSFGIPSELTPETASLLPAIPVSVSSLEHS